MSEFEDIARRMREIREQEGRAPTLIEDAPKASIAIDQSAPAAPVELTDDDFIYGGGFCI